MPAISMTVERALRAASAVAAYHGICCEQAAVVHSGSKCARASGPAEDHRADAVQLELG
jgi:hypothetical protein